MNLTRHIEGATRYASKEEAKLAADRARRVFIDRLAVDKLVGQNVWIVAAYMERSIRFLVEAA